MRLHLEPVTEQNRKHILKLHTAKGQEGFIETVGQCLSEADERSDWRPVGIYDGDLLVGFAMYGYFHEYEPEGRVWMDRLLIDKSHQHKGYGTRAMEMLLERICGEYVCHEVYLSVIPGNHVASNMYQRFGFHFTGEKDVHGEDVMRLRLSSR